MYNSQFYSCASYFVLHRITKKSRYIRRQIKSLWRNLLRYGLGLFFYINSKLIFFQTIGFPFKIWIWNFDRICVSGISPSRLDEGENYRRSVFDRLKCVTNLLQEMEYLFVWKLIYIPHKPWTHKSLIGWNRFWRHKNIWELVFY